MEERQVPEPGRATAPCCPILHLNGYKISGPTVLGRDRDEDIRKLLEATATRSTSSRATTRRRAPGVRRDARRVLRENPRDPGRGAQRRAVTKRPTLAGDRAPHAKGWTGPKVVDGAAGRGHLPRAPGAARRRAGRTPSSSRCSSSGCAATEPERTLRRARRGSSRAGRARPARATGAWARTRTPTAASSPWTSICPTSATTRSPSTKPATERHESTRQLGKMMRDIFYAEARSRRTSGSSAPTRRTRIGWATSSRSRTAASSGTILPIDDHVSPDGRVMEVLSEHLCQGWLEGYLLTGRHGLFATYEAFAMVSASMTVQHTKWLEEAVDLPWRAPVPSLNILLTSTCWRNDHNGFSHQGPGLIDTVLSKKGTVARIYLPPDANCLLSVADHCLRSRELRQPDRHRQAAAAAVARHGRGRRSTARAAPRSGPGRATTARAKSPTWCWPAPATSRPWRRSRRRGWLRKHAPELKVRVVNVVDLMSLFPRRPAPARPGGDAVRRALHRRQAGRLRLPRLPAGASTRSCTGGPTPSASTCAASSRRARPPRPSTWSC